MKGGGFGFEFEFESLGFGRFWGFGHMVLVFSFSAMMFGVWRLFDFTCPPGPPLIIRTVDQIYMNLYYALPSIPSRFGVLLWVLLLFLHLNSPSSAAAAGRRQRALVSC